MNTSIPATEYRKFIDDYNNRFRHHFVHAEAHKQAARIADTRRPMRPGLADNHRQARDAHEAAGSYYGTALTALRNTGKLGVSPEALSKLSTRAEQMTKKANALGCRVVISTAVKKCDTNPTELPLRIQLITNAILSFTGRWTKKGYPWVTDLRKHAQMADITVAERNRLTKKVLTPSLSPD